MNKYIEARRNRPQVALDLNRLSHVSGREFYDLPEMVHEDNMDDLSETSESVWANESSIDLIADLRPDHYRAMYSSAIDEDGEGDWL
jgi:hypothetical protein